MYPNYSCSTAQIELRDLFFGERKLGTRMRLMRWRKLAGGRAVDNFNSILLEYCDDWGFHTSWKGYLGACSYTHVVSYGTRWLWARVCVWKICYHVPVPALYRTTFEVRASSEQSLFPVLVLHQSLSPPPRHWSMNICNQLSRLLHFRIRNCTPIHSERG